MPIGGERAAVQNPFLRYAQEAGWTYLSVDEALDLRRGHTSPVLDTVLVDQLQRLNPGIVGHTQAEDIRSRLIRVRPNIEGNQDAFEYLKGLKTVFVEAEKPAGNANVHTSNVAQIKSGRELRKRRQIFGNTGWLSLNDFSSPVNKSLIQ